MAKIALVTGGGSGGSVNIPTTPTVPVTSLPSPTPTTPVTTSPSPITKQLKYGMTDPQVSILQQFLINQSLLASGNVTGKFKSMTLAALKSFQCTYLKVCSGTVFTTGYGATGPTTRSLINQMNGVR